MNLVLPLSERQELQYSAGKTAALSFVVDIHGRSCDPQKCSGCVCAWNTRNPPAAGRLPASPGRREVLEHQLLPLIKLIMGCTFYDVTASASVNARPEQ